jgi:hypothetical protein
VPRTITGSSGVSVSNGDGVAGAPALSTSNIPVASLPNGTTTVVTTTSTGAQADFAPGLAGDTILFCNNATDLTISGFSGGVAGQLLSIVSRGAGHVYLKNANTGSSANNRLINYVTGGDTPLAAGVGSAIYQWGSDGTISRWFLVSHSQGSPITVTYASGNFTSNAGSWTVQSGDQVAYEYTLVGRLMTLTYTIDTTTVAGGPTVLYVTIPGGFSSTGVAQGMMWFIDNGGTGTIGNTQVTGGTLVGNFNSAVSAWAASTNLTYVRTTFTFRVT